MSWMKVDDQFHSSDKLLSIPKRHRFQAAGLWAIAGSWVAGQQTDGFVPDYMILEWGPTKKTIDCLVDSGLWERVRDGFKFVHWRKRQDGDYRRNIPPKVRAAVMRRDGYRCVVCGATERLSLDHIVPYRDDGPDTVENLRVLCMPCNNRRYQEERRRGASDLV